MRIFKLLNGRSYETNIAVHRGLFKMMGLYTSYSNINIIRKRPCVSLLHFMHGFLAIGKCRIEMAISAQGCLLPAKRRGQYCQKQNLEVQGKIVLVNS